jgi:hypothetical protein
MDILSRFLLTLNLFINYLITTSGDPCTCSTEHQKPVTNTVSIQSTLFSATNMTQEDKMYAKEEPKFPNVLVGRFRSCGMRHCCCVTSVYIFWV